MTDPPPATTDAPPGSGQGETAAAPHRVLKIEPPYNPPSFLGLSVSPSSHAFSGYAAGTLFGAAGLVGAIRFLRMETQAHAFRDASGGGRDDEIGGECAAVIRSVWSGEQWLRWLHVGMLSSGEAFYLYDPITGMSMMRPGGPPPGAGKIHRAAYFVHLGLMASEIVLGFLSSYALSRGDHELLVGLAAGHAAVGIAIPVLIIGSGIYVQAAQPKLPI